MARAYDRVKTANQQSDNFIKTPYWTPEVEEEYEKWAETGKANDLDDLVSLQLESEVAVSFKALDGSICCTLAHQPSKDSGLPYLLTGWSDNAPDAMRVALFKLERMLQGVWAAPPAPKATRRR